MHVMPTVRWVWGFHVHDFHVHDFHVLHFGGVGGWG